MFLRSLKQVTWKKSAIYFLSPKEEHNTNGNMKSSKMKLSYIIIVKFSVLLLIFDAPLYKWNVF